MIFPLLPQSRARLYNHFLSSPASTARACSPLRGTWNPSIENAQSWTQKRLTSERKPAQQKNTYNEHEKGSPAKNRDLLYEKKFQMKAAQPWKTLEMDQVFALESAGKIYYVQMTEKESDKVLRIHQNENDLKSCFV